jgi:nucleoid-associated protein YgaU
MRNHIKFVALTAMLSLPVGLLAAEDSWYNPKSWFNKDKKNTSTTVTGNVESIKDQVIFKTFDGQTLLLIGKQATKVGECGTNVKIRVFGNVYKPSDKYPTGALQVRNYKVLDEAAATSPIVATEDKETVSNEPTPEPYEEPSLEAAPELAEETNQEITATQEKDDVVVEVKEEPEEEVVVEKTAKTYVVQSGDTLGKISSKLFGTTTKWKKIAEANGITNPKHLKVGMTLKVPEL